MAVGYCKFHKKYLDRDELKSKSCKCKKNTKKICKHLELFKTKVVYRNSTNHIACKGGRR